MNQQRKTAVILAVSIVFSATAGCFWGRTVERKEKEVQSYSDSVNTRADIKAKDVEIKMLRQSLKECKKSPK